MEGQIILFGCGEIGTKACEFLGSHNIQCFCDNNPDLAGQTKCGKPVISFDKLKREYRDAIVIISADRGNADQITRQCEESGIEDFLVYETMRDSFENGEQLLAFIQEPSNRLYAKMKFYRDKVRELRLEIDYFKRHSDIRSMKPAIGKLRERQMRTVRASAELIERLKGLEIKPYLTGGNLLGYLRSGGFIPWDDDIDFDLIREEYERLKEYCISHMYSKEEYDRKEESGRKVKQVDSDMEGYFWLDHINHFQVNVTFPDGDSIGVDFFPIDYYCQDCSFEQLMELVGRMKQEWRMAGMCREKKEACVERAKQENKKNVVKESNNLYFGVDNLANFRNDHKGGWIPREIVFPLQQVSYEGELFWVPANTAEYVTYLHKSIWEFPSDNIAIPKHFQRHGIVEEKQ